MELNSEPYPTRVWMGYCRPELKKKGDGKNSFCKKLGAVFIPATVQIMAPLGLSAYLPTIVPDDTCSDVPDEIALVFYESKKAYRDTLKTVGGRAYSMLHGTVFNFSHDGDIPPSHSGFPNFYQGEINLKTPYYYLFDHTVDWQKGQTMASIVVNTELSLNNFTDQAMQWFSRIQKETPKGMDGAVFAIFQNCVVFWSHWISRDMVQTEFLNSFESVRTVINSLAKSCRIPMGIDDEFEGLSVSQGDSFNFEVNKPNYF